MSKIPLGKKCPICRKVHIVKPLKDVSPTNRKKIKKLDHYVFREGYYGSLVLKNEVWEFYKPLVEKRVVIQIKQPEPEEDSMKAYDEDFEGSYIYYDDEDAEEENC